jgi:hypothetical protein
LQDPDAGSWVTLAGEQGVDQGLVRDRGVIFDGAFVGNLHY